MALTIASKKPAHSDIMPDLEGLGARQAAFWLQTRGVAVTLKGSGQVAHQSVEAGEPLPDRVVLQCK